MIALKKISIETDQTDGRVTMRLAAFDENAEPVEDPDDPGKQTVYGIFCNPGYDVELAIGGQNAFLRSEGVLPIAKPYADEFRAAVAKAHTPVVVEAVKSYRVASYAADEKTRDNAKRNKARAAKVAARRALAEAVAKTQA